MQTNKGFSKDLEESGKKLEALQKRQAAYSSQLSKTQVHVVEMKKALIDANKAFREQNDELSKSNLEKAYEDYNNAQEAVKGWRNEIKAANKEMQELSDQQQRSENRADGTLGTLATGALGKMVGNSLSNAIGTRITSAFGEVAGNTISSIASGALTGAMLGSVIPGLGNAVGALVGGAAGAISGLIDANTAEFDIKNTTFKSVRDDMVNNANQSQAEALASSINVSMGREKTNVQLRHMFGNEDLAGQYLQNTISLANKTPFYYSDLIGVGSTYKSFGYANDELYEEQLRIANAAAIRGWDASEMESVASTLGYMRQSGKMNTLQVKQLQMKGLNIPRYLAIAGSDFGRDLSQDEIRSMMGMTDEQLKAKGVTLTESDIYGMLSDMDGSKAAQAISEMMAAEFSGGAEKLAETYYGL